MNKSNILTQWQRTVCMVFSLILMLSMLWTPLLADVSASSLHSQEPESIFVCTTSGGVTTCHDESSGVITIFADQEQQQPDDQPISQSQLMTTEELSVDQTQESGTFLVRTYTPTHSAQPNKLWSDYSESVSATTWSLPTAIPTVTPTDMPTPTPTPTNTLIPATLVGRVEVVKNEIDVDDYARWNIALSNVGEIAAENVQLEVDLPMGTTLAPVSMALGWLCTEMAETNGVVTTCSLDLGPLAPNSELDSFLAVLANDINPNDPVIQEPGIIVTSDDIPDGINISAGIGNNVDVVLTPKIESPSPDEALDPHAPIHIGFLPLIFQ